MWRFMTFSWILLAACSFSLLEASVFYSHEDANKVLKIQKRENSFLEELKAGSLERECYEEPCDLEEAMEIFKSREATLGFWTKYIDGDQCEKQPCNNGTCLDAIGGFNCICNKGWEGLLCQHEVLYTNCSICNGGCEHYCKEDPGNQRRYCSCALGYKLMEDYSRCLPDVEFPCGKVKVNVESKKDIHIRLINGKTGRKGDSPWQVMLSDGRGKFKCGGVLIHAAWVLTAAHCVEDEGRYKVKLGKYHRLRDEETEQIILVDKVVTHENYTKVNSDNDIAMLHLAKPMVFNKNALPICLPTKELAEQELTRSGKQMVVTGWGSKTEKTMNFSNVLNYIEIPLVPRNVCVQVMRHDISENMLCAGTIGNQQDACGGDSGGPMITTFKNTSFLVGLVSWGEGCGKSEKFGVYTKVSQYLQWIQRQIKASENTSNN
ncbi:PREDICTED: vitamin K-dependent protein C-like isoform X1 [Crocodylus porosus]|uniref:Vitamin K-dependent protein C n=1 Tax=Crocodylus porosus TaxID=8502 RepID=A0A7M4EMI8_CROPO|nr:PREDICTED: vitamin K-dependent protein C-like isoform X1 [Crocodylus porosus]